MSKKQTAVEWLIDELNEMGIRYLDLGEEQIKQALQLEREQIEEAHKAGVVDGDFSTGFTSSDYYTQTYGECTQQ